ncbi:alpha-acetolactate decarboxylase [Liquorilactobacillus sucicola DSM 21376 = JCM 15457]|uniref:Alpha-acetolactate decarboxylase n=1 Tax=Liquorilactobacillus sucicola DSM 21376 = JCM 15457 TaxID=1423806 RepID=A0A023CX30_9LACO|nr:acetolactate decarboxylase [Liquorilactobacillus sucicola]KRN06971.1 alpha-acetolactate decarboxylase [Liquorilactobacillus sucicola DSM 21376 = JCM 15457]GAJ26453.1 alpha-acetolactate decarboxylase [Liquorilactobacillus sucicola DSM 21376 = JCM 15457]
MKQNNVLYQHGTLALLVPGLLAGTITMKELLQHGDTGIGTGEGLNGELIILDGVPYQADSFGNVHVVKDDFTMPFANINFAAFKFLTTLENAGPEEFAAAALRGKTNANTFFAVRVKGRFSYVRTRAVVKSEPPFDTLEETAKKQSIFEAHDVEGTLLSYYSPTLFHGAAVAGFHNHFLTNDHSMGGHVLDFKLASGELAIQTFDTLEQHLPVNNSEFMEHDFSQDNVADVISKAE